MKSPRTLPHMQVVECARMRLPAPQGSTFSGDEAADMVGDTFNVDTEGGARTVRIVSVQVVCDGAAVDCRVEVSAEVAVDSLDEVFGEGWLS